MAEPAGRHAGRPLTGREHPVSTYRLQLRDSFGFGQAAEQVRGRLAIELELLGQLVAAAEERSLPAAGLMARLGQGLRVGRRRVRQLRDRPGRRQNCSR